MLGTAWESGGWDFVLSLPRAQVLSLVEELNMPNAGWHSQKKNKCLEQEKSWHLGGKKSHLPPPPEKRAGLKVEEELDTNELALNL